MPDTLEIERVSLHDARHSCASLMHARHVPIATIAAWFWSRASEAFTMAVYTHSADEALKAAAVSFSRVVTTRDTETGSPKWSERVLPGTGVPPVGLEPTLGGF
jgi:integrase